MISYNEKLVLIHATYGYGFDSVKLMNLNLIAKNTYTYFEYLLSMQNAKNNCLVAAITPLFYATQQSFFIEFNKIFDKSGKDARDNNIYNYIKYLDEKDGDKFWIKYLSHYNNLIESIRLQRNKLFAHNIVIKDTSKICMSLDINEVEGLLKFCIDITDCYDVNIPHRGDYCYRNKLLFDKIIESSIDTIMEVNLT